MHCYETELMRIYLKTFVVDARAEGIDETDALERIHDSGIQSLVDLYRVEIHTVRQILTGMEKVLPDRAA